MRTVEEMQRRMMGDETSFELRSQLYTQISAVAQSRAELYLQGWGLL